MVLTIQQDYHTFNSRIQAKQRAAVAAGRDMKQIHSQIKVLALEMVLHPEPARWRAMTNRGRHLVILIAYVLLSNPLTAQTDTIPGAAHELSAANTPDPASTSLLLMPTGRTLPAGSGMVGLAAPYIPYGAISVAENWQISAGGVYVFSGAIGTGEEYYSYVILKHTLFEDGGSSIAVGGAVMFWGREELSGPYPGWKRATIPGGFAVATLGSDESALTLGLGFADVVGGFGIGFEGGFTPGIGLGYETYLSPDWKLMTEHFSAVLSRGTLHSVGVRYFFAKAAFDLGMVIIPNGDVNISGTRLPLALPFVGISVQL
jgi:hypothetical protein